MVSSAGSREKIAEPCLDFDFRLRSCSRYSRLAAKLKNSAAYPVKISAMWTRIHPLRSNGFVNWGGCCPTAAENVSRNTSGNTKIPGDVVRYRMYTPVKNTIIRNASSDSE